MSKQRVMSYLCYSYLQNGKGVCVPHNISIVVRIRWIYIYSILTPSCLTSTIYILV